MSAARQVWLIALALLVWSAASGTWLLLGARMPGLGALVVAYLLALALAQLPTIRALLRDSSPASLWSLALLMAAPGVSQAWRTRTELADSAGLHGLWQHTLDRRRLQDTPSIAPPLVTADRPQRFFVYDPAAHALSLQLGPRVKRLPARALGHGVFRVDYDPARDGLPSPSDGALTATLATDHGSFERSLRSASALAHPRWLSLSPSGTQAACVSEETDELVVVTRAGLALRTRVGDGPRDAVFVNDSQIVVSLSHGQRLQLIALPSGQVVQELAAGAPLGRLALSPDGTLLAAAAVGGAPAILLVDVHTLRQVQRLPIDHEADWLAFGRDRGLLVFTTRNPAQLVRAHMTSTGFAIDRTLPLSRPASTLARSHDGASVRLAVTDYDAQARPQLGNHFVQDQLLDIDLVSLQLTTRTLTARRSERQSKPGDHDRGASPLGLWQAADGRWLEAFAGSDELWWVSSAQPDPQILDVGDSGLHAPHGAVALADGSLVVTSPLQGAIGIFAPGSHAPKLVQLAPSDASLLAHNQAALERRVGERGFYEATRSGISCQSCHQHADSDEAAYNLGDHRLIPTLSVRGLLWTGPYLRDGSYAHLADLDEVAQTLYRGYLRSQRARGQAVQAYLEALPRRAALGDDRANGRADDRDLARERRGLDAFFRARCPTCHSPPAFTSLGELPMQQLFPREAKRLPAPELLDTPSLLSVSASAPYLNDGRAHTLAEVIGRFNRDNLHGDTRALSQTEQTELVYFLSTL